MENLHVVGCTGAGCSRPSMSPIAAGSVRAIAGTSKESGGKDDADTPIAVIDAVGTAAEVGKPISTA